MGIFASLNILFSWVNLPVRKLMPLVKVRFSHNRFDYRLGYSVRAHLPRERMISKQKPTKASALKEHGIRSKSSPDMLGKYSKPLKPAGKEFNLILSITRCDLRKENFLFSILFR